MAAPVQETILQALVSPQVPRVFIHSGCGGWVLFSLGGGQCLECGSYPLGSWPRPWSAGLYEKPESPICPASRNCADMTREQQGVAP